MATNPAANAIRRARRAAQNEMARSLREFERRLLELFARYAAQIRIRILDAADGSGLLQISAGPTLRREIDTAIDQLRGDAERLVLASGQNAAGLGVAVFADRPLRQSVAQVRADVLRTWRTFTAEDGLQLSDRVWRSTAQARRDLQQAVEQALVEGASASRAAQEFIARGEGVPDDLIDKRDRARAVAIANRAGQDLDGGRHYRATLQVLRTETIRAHGLAHRAAAEADPDVVGVRFTLSPRHPAPDICDMHARANLHGLGPGVYPTDRSPWPAHPNTFSFEQVVFADEVTDEDRAGRQRRVDWLDAQADDIVLGVLGGSNPKLRAFRAGLVGERSIATPWRVLRRRLERQGVDVEAFEAGP
jgi:hypothetical protein